MRPYTSKVAALLVLSVVGNSACGPKASTSTPTTAPTFAPHGEAKCGVSASQLEPLVVEWPSAARGELEARLRKGVIAVRFTGCELEVLPRCMSAIAYSYVGTTKKRDLVTMRDADDLFAKLPRGALRLEAELERSGELDVSTTVVGRFQTDRTNIGTDDLHGECAEATHVIAAASVGAFDFYSVGRGTVKGGIGAGDVGVNGSSSAERRSLQMDGDEKICASATRDDKAPPDGCSAILKIQLEPIGGSKKLVPVCPDGSAWDGNACVRTQIVSEVQCPKGSKWDGKTCVPLDRGEGVPTPYSLHMSFMGGTDRWGLYDRSGALICAVPCTHWVSFKDGYQLRRQGANDVIPLAKFDNIPGQHVIASIESGPSTLQASMISFGFIFGGSVLGVGVAAAVGVPDLKPAEAPTLIAGGTLTAVGLLGLVLMATNPEWRTNIISTASGVSPSFRRALSPSGLTITF